MMNLEIGTQVGDYRILSLIGKGSYGIVFEAEHVITRRVDALKLMLDVGPWAADEEQRFLREIQVQASLQHPNIATVYTAFRTEWGLALVMELVKGQSLRAILEKRRLPLSEGVGYMLATLAGLSCAERVGAVHRDIKPDNILITPDGTTKLTDFGLVHVLNSPRITGSGEYIGTPCYMSPEQVTAEQPVDGRSDVYSTGVVLYEVVTGKPPFQGNNGFAVMLAHQNTPPVPPIEIEPAIGPQLNQVILKALEKDPNRRFQTVAEFYAALEEAVPAPAVADVVELPRKINRSTRWRIAVAAGVALGVCGLATWAGPFRIRHRAAEPAPAAGSTLVAKPIESPPLALRDLPPAPPDMLPAGSEPETMAAPSTAPERQLRRKRTPARPVAKTTADAGHLRITTTELPPARPEPEIRRTPVHLAEDAPAPAIPEPGLAPSPAKAPEVAIPATVPDGSKATPVKRPNVFRRALGRIFGKRVAGQDAAPADKPALSPAAARGESAPSGSVKPAP